MFMLTGADRDDVQQGSPVAAPTRREPDATDRIGPERGRTRVPTENTDSLWAGWQR